MLWQRLWLKLCTKQVVSATACINRFLPYSSSGIAIFGMRTVQADSCLNSEQIDTLFNHVGGQDGGLGVGGHFGPNLLATVRNIIITASWCMCGRYNHFWQENHQHMFTCSVQIYTSVVNPRYNTADGRIEISRVLCSVLCCAVLCCAV